MVDSEKVLVERHITSPASGQHDGDARDKALVLLKGRAKYGQAYWVPTKRAYWIPIIDFASTIDLFICI